MTQTVLLPSDLLDDVRSSTIDEYEQPDLIGYASQSEYDRHREVADGRLIAVVADAETLSHEAVRGELQPIAYESLDEVALIETSPLLAACPRHSPLMSALLHRFRGSLYALPVRCAFRGVLLSRNLAEQQAGSGPDLETILRSCRRWMIQLSLGSWMDAAMSIQILASRADARKAPASFLQRLGDAETVFLCEMITTEDILRLMPDCVVGLSEATIRALHEDEAMPPRTFSALRRQYDFRLGSELAPPSVQSVAIPAAALNWNSSRTAIRRLLSALARKRIADGWIRELSDTDRLVGDHFVDVPVHEIGATLGRRSHFERTPRRRRWQRLWDESMASLRARGAVHSHQNANGVVVPPAQPSARLEETRPDHAHPVRTGGRILSPRGTGDPKRLQRRTGQMRG